MQIHLNTDHNLKRGESLESSVRATVAGALARFSAQITRVDVHLADENADKSGAADKRCVMEARLDGHPPVVVTEHAATVGQAIDGAADRLVHRLDRVLERQRDHRVHDKPPLVDELP